MLSRSALRTSLRCTLCGHRLLSTAAAVPARSTGSAQSSAQVTLPRWSSSQAFSTAAAGSSSRNLRNVRPTAGLGRWQPRRTYATILETPTAAEDDLPEPVLQGGQEDAGSTLNITAAAEKQLARIQEREKDPNLALRILVESGGCHGYSTKLQVADVTKDRQEDDYILSATSSVSAATKSGLLLVDALTLSLIRGSTLDYATELIGSSFRLIDNPQAKGAGCGCGVSWELKI